MTKPDKCDINLQGSFPLPLHNSESYDRDALPNSSSALEFASIVSQTREMFEYNIKLNSTQREWRDYVIPNAGDQKQFSF